jgi:predicted AlkP superfamily phosphohydrolase/phosphomutase
LFLEIDAGDKVVIQEGASQGWLPTFRDLFDQGLVGDTLAPKEIFVGAIWPSLYTAVNPAKQGIHSLVQLRTGTYEFYRCYTGENIKRKPFWTYLSDAGRRVAIFDIPLSGISEGINGIQSVEWGSHDANYGFRAWPKSFEDDVLWRFGRHPLDTSCNEHGSQPEDFVALRDKLLEGVRRKAELTRHYLRQGGWDFFAQVFTESHCVGHQCWHLHDAKHPGHDRALVAATGDPLKAVYQAIDRSFGEIIEEAGDNATVIVLAGHRMTYKFGAQFLLPEVLLRLGVARERRVPLRAKAARQLDAALARGWNRMPADLRQSLPRLRRVMRGALDGATVQPRFAPHLETLDLRNSRCFLMDNGFPVSGLRLNLVGREPAGLIHRGPEMERFCKQLSADLCDLRHADSGEPAIIAVQRTADHYQGEYLDDLPDLLVEWNGAMPLGSASCGNPAGSLVRLRSDKIGLVEGVNSYIRTGDHRPEGIFAARGPNIQPGRLHRTVSIMDFAPTFCALLDTVLPDVDGKPIGELLPFIA